MRFRCSASTASIVVRPADFIVEAGVRRRTHALRAEFRSHTFDSERAQEELGWTDEERKQVEQAVLNHREFSPLNARLGFARFYLEGQPIGDPVVSQAGIAEPELRCIYTFVGDGGDSEQCSQRAGAGIDFCQDHNDLLVGAMKEVASVG